MNTTGLIVAIFVSFIFVVKLVLSFIGIDTDVGDSDFDTGDINTSDFGMEWSDFFSLKGFLNFMFGFSWSWACFGMDNGIWVFNIFVGFCCVAILFYLYKYMSKLEVESTNEPKTNLVNRYGSVYTVYSDHESSENGVKFAAQIVYNGSMSMIEMYTHDNISVGDTIIVDEVTENGIIKAKKI